MGIAARRTIRVRLARQIAVAGDALLVAEPEARGDGARLVLQLRIRDLRQIDHPMVMAEILARELGMAIDAETADDQPLENAAPGNRSGRRCRVQPPPAQRTRPRSRRIRSSARPEAARYPPRPASGRACRRCRSRRRPQRCAHSVRAHRRSRHAPPRECVPAGCAAPAAGRSRRAPTSRLARFNAVISRDSAPQAITSTRSGTAWRSRLSAPPGAPQPSTWRSQRRSRRRGSTRRRRWLCRIPR